MSALVRHLLAAVLVATLAACSSSPESTLGELPRTPQASVEQMLQQAAKASPEEAAALRLAAADQLSARQDYARAREVLQQVPEDNLPPAQQIFAATLRAELAMTEHDATRALQWLDDPAMARLGELPTEQQVRTQLVRANAFQATGRNLEAARERTFIAPLLAGQQAEDNHERIWELVASLPADQLGNRTGDVDLDGWLSLGAAVKGAGTVARQQAAIDSWQLTHPQHPAARRLPQPLVKLREIANEPLTRIALLLPQQGQLAGVSRALRDGFIAARFASLEAGEEAPEVLFYDSSRVGSMDDFYRQAQADGVQLVIGPLEKDRVKELGNRDALPITTLALNYSDAGAKIPPQLFQFGLAAEDEAREVARRALAEGRQSGVALIPRGDWGDRVLAAFQQELQAGGGRLVDFRRIDKPVDMSGQIAELVKSNGGGIDFMFLAATPQQARQVKPTLAYQYAADLPVYATSHLFSGNTASADQDLNGIRFCETPWLLETDDQLRQQIIRQWPQAAGTLGRLYAMGTDAFRLAPRLAQLEALPDSRIEGLSGDLSLTADHRIERHLPWAEFQNGRVQRLDDPMLPSVPAVPAMTALPR